MEAALVLGRNAYGADCRASQVYNTHQRIQAFLKLEEEAMHARGFVVAGVSDEEEQQQKPGDFDGSDDDGDEGGNQQQAVSHTSLLCHYAPGTCSH